MELRKKIHNYFAEKANPYSNRRLIKKHSVLAVCAALLSVTVLAILLTGGEKDRKEGPVSQVQNAPASAPKNSLSPGTEYDDASNYLSRKGEGGKKADRQYSASQIVRAGDSDGSNGRLPQGTIFPARLLNRIVSSDANTPVIAQLTEDAAFDGSVVIPADSRLLGQATFDESGKRLQLRFTTTVFPDGTEHGLSAMALEGDGSAGLAGEYDSGRTTQQAGRFIGKFVGGLSQGLKDKNSSTWGRAYEPGSLKNGLLNGLAESAFDQAEIQAEQMKNGRARLEVAAGTRFLIYLERELKL